MAQSNWIDDMINETEQPAEDTSWLADLGSQPEPVAEPPGALPDETADPFNAWLAGAGEPEPIISLADRYGVPPFSVLRTASGEWQKRKREWLALGIQSELGRDDMALWTSEAMIDYKMDHYRDREKKKARSRAGLTFGEFCNDITGPCCGTSIFDPVLTELLVRWYSPRGGRVLDPFAGGSVRGIVAAALGRKYTGIDISARQVEANRAQWADIAPKLPAGTPEPRWIVGDAQDVQTLARQPYDFIMTCPPYGDLEVYSDDPRDLSAMDYPQFRVAYRLAIRRSIEMLRPGRFAAIVVGEIRDPDGYMRGFVPDTIAAFTDARMHLYNEAILLNALGTAPVRTRQFAASRKVVKVHQNVLVFANDWKAAVAACGSPGTFLSTGNRPMLEADDE
jgi:hypothetical protein